MIFYFKTNGHLVYNSQTEICQGSNGANTIYVIAPFATTSQVTARILLPNGKRINAEYLSRKRDLSAEYFSIDGVGLTVWGFDLPYSATKLCGRVIIQFAFTTSTETITTESISILVKRGVEPANELNIADDNIIDEILSYLALAEENVEASTGKLDKVESTTDKKQAYVKRANGLQDMHNISENGAGDIVSRQIDGNIYAGEPQGNNDATPKHYVDNLVQETANSHFTKQEINDKLDIYCTKDFLDHRLNQNYYTKVDLEGKLLDYPTNAKVDEKFYNKSQVDSKIDECLSSEELNSKLSIYQTVYGVDKKLENYSTTEQVNEKLNNYINETKMSNILKDYYTSEEIIDRLSNLITTTEFNAKFSKYYTKTNADKTFYKKTEVDSILNQKQNNLIAGDNIKIENDVVSYKNDEYEHIMDFIVGYSVLTEKPSNWETNYTDYYKNMGTAKEPNYQALAELETWETGKYYSFSTNDSGVFSIDREPDGTMFKFKKAKVVFNTPIYGSNLDIRLLVYWNGNGNTIWSSNISKVCRRDMTTESFIYIKRYEKNVMYSITCSRGARNSVPESSCGVAKASETIRYIYNLRFYDTLPPNSKISIYAERGAYDE